MKSIISREDSIVSREDLMSIWNLLEQNQSIIVGVQFKAAWYRSNITSKQWNVEYIEVKNINENHMTPRMLVDWLLGSDIHFILSHVHQGIASYLQWNVQELEFQLQRLTNHLGFPKGKNLLCPVFLQNKFEYLRLLPTATVNQTLQIFLTFDDTYYDDPNMEFMNFLKRLKC